MQNRSVRRVSLNLEVETDRSLAELRRAENIAVYVSGWGCVRVVQAQANVFSAAEPVERPKPKLRKKVAKKRV